ncbi:MAG: protein kinase, partial [Planctomycetota bacterium]
HPRRGAVLADLGLVRRDEDVTLTRQGAALGSPAYMSPEQARDPSAVDAQADIYSLGATLHHALGGRPPFLGRGVGEVIHRVLHEEPEALHEGVPSALARVVATAMAKDPERRYERARDFGHDLGRVLLGHAPRLLTRDRRRRLRRRWMIAAAAPLLLAFGWWAQPWSWWTTTSAPSPDEVAGVPEDGAPPVPLGDPDGTEAVGSPRGPRDPAEAFLAWSRGHRRDFAAALGDGELRLALDVLGDLEGAGAPEDAPAGFLQERRRFLADGRRQVDAAAERVAGQAMDLLDVRLRLARENLAGGAFQAEAWSREVRQAWQRAGLSVADLPLRPGAADPEGRLRLAATNLEAEAEVARVAQALERVPGLVDAGQRLLRQGRFAEARRRWEGLEPQALLQSPEARAEVVRIDELLALDRRLEARLREQVGQELELTLRSGSILAGALVPDDDGYALDYFGQARIPVRLLELEAAHAVTWLGGTEDVWLTAQLLWCQDELAAALAAMRRVAPSTTPEERQPRHWLFTWQLETDLREGLLEAEPGEPEPVPSDAEPAGPVEAVVGGDPRLPLERAIRRLQPQAEFLRRDDGSLEVVLRDLLLDPDFNLDLRADLRGFRLGRLSLMWDHPRGEALPKRLSFLEDLELSHPGGRLLPSLRVAGSRADGFGVLAGAGRQVLAWDGREVSLDGLMVAPWTGPSARGGRVRLEASTPFRLAELRLRYRPQ